MRAPLSSKTVIRTARLNQSDYERGIRDSKTAIAEGTPTLFWGTRGSWGVLLTRLMSERFGVIVEHLDCFTTEAKQSYEQGFNEATRQFIDRSHGSGSFQATLDEVEKFRKKQSETYVESNQKKPD